jgi:hypothetical protein
MRASLVFGALSVAFVAGCVTRDDGVLLLRRREARRDGDPTTLAYVQPNDVTAAVVRGVLADGFGAELLRAYAMARRLAGRGGEPAIVAFGSEDTYRGVPYRERQFDGRWFTEVLPPSAPIVWIDESDPDPLTARLTAALGGAIVDTVVGGPGRAPTVLREGYATFLTVVAGEWNAPPGLDERDQLRTLPAFATVRANQGILSAGRHERLSPSHEVLREPQVVATVLYRMAASEAGRRMAPAEIYRPFLAVAAPRDIHPALLLGAFRNFQAKLFAAWRNAVTAGRPPADLIDLLDAYAEAYPAERPELTRILVVSMQTLSEWYEPSVLAEAGAHVERVTAAVLFGRYSLRDVVTALPARD